MATTNHNFRIKNGLEVGGTVIVTSEGVMTIPTNSTGSTQDGGTNNTSLATTAFVQQEITSLIGGAPTALDTLNELAAAINGDSNYNTTLTTALATKLPLAGGTLTGTLSIAATNNYEIDITGSPAGNIRANADLYLLSQTGSLNLGAGGSNSRLVITTLGNVTTTGSITSANTVQGKSLKVNTPDEGNAPALTAVVDLLGYEGRGAGINIRDKVNSATNASNREWFIGSGYSQSGFNIGYSSTGTQTSYTAQNKLSIDTLGNVTAAGTVTATGGNSTNWNTAYGWGNHASAGYLTSISSPENGDWWNNGYVRVQTDGVMEVGKYLDFHTSDSGGNTDYDLRVTASSGALAIGGTVTWSGGGSANANTAYGWGDHASAGYSDEYKNYSVASGADHDTHHWNKTHAGYSNSGSSPSYIVLTTNVPQDNYSMGGFTLIFQNHYNTTDEGDVVNVYGYWNPESNGGFSGFRYHATNPDCNPTIEVGRNSSGKTVFIIYNESGAYAQVIAKDLYLGYSASSANSSWGDSWAFSEASTLSAYTNRNTLNRTGLTAAQVTNWDTAYTYSQVGHLPLVGGTLTGPLSITATNNTEIDMTGSLAGNIRANADLYLLSQTGSINLGAGGTNSKLVINTSGNATFAGTLSSGAITASESSAASTALTLGSSSQTSFTKADWKTSEHGVGVAYIIAYGAGHSSQAGNFAIKNLATGKDIYFELASGVEPLRLTSTGATFAGTISSGAITSTGASTFGGVQIGGTTVISSSRNLTNIGAITSSGNLITGNGNVSMDASANGQVQINGSGYTGAIALDGTAMHLYHNSSFRSLILGTNETARLTISGTGAFNFNANNLSSIGTISSGAITSSGKLQINQAGTGTSNSNVSPVAVFSGQSQGGTVNALSLVNSVTGANNNGVSIGFHNANAWSPTGTITTRQEATGTNTDSRMVFQTYRGSLQDALVLDHDQNAIVYGHMYAEGGNITAGTATTDSSVKVFHSDGDYSIQKGWGMEFARTASYLRPNTDNDRTMYFGASTLRWDQIRLHTTSLKMGAVQFLDASRNASFNTISSGAITSTGTSSFNNFQLSDSSRMGFGTVKAGATVGHHASADEGIFWHTGNNYGIYRTAGNWTSPNYPYLRIQFDTGIKLDGGAAGTHDNSGVDIVGSSDLQMGGTTVIDASRNISAGNITASGSVTANSRVFVNADHGTTKFQLAYEYSGQNHANNADLLIWASEPGVSYNGGGFGLNIHESGQYYGRADDNKNYGVYMRMTPHNGYTEFWNTTGARGTTAGQGTKRVSIEADGRLVTHTGGVASVGQITTSVSNLSPSIYASASDAYIRVGGSGGAGGVFGAHREGVSSSSLDYTTYIGYDCYFDDGTNKWYALRTDLGRKWKTNFGGYHQNRFTISTYDGGGASGSSLAAGWLETDWTERFGVSSTGVVDIGSSLRIGTTTVIDSSRNVTANSLTVSNGAVFSDITFAFLTTGSSAQNIRTKSVFAGTSYNSTPPAGSFNATNTYEANGTTVIDSSRNIYAAAVTASSIVSSDNVAFGNSGNIPMDGSSNGQVEIKGNGYQGAIALDATAMHIYHNSAERSLVLGTNETARMSISGSGTFDFHGRSLEDIGAITTQGALLLTVSDTDSAHQRVDVRDETNGHSRAHWYGVSDNGTTSNFRHAWYDGNSYINVTAASNKVTFSGSLAATSRIQAGAYTSSDSSVIAQTGDIQLRIGSTSINHNPYVRFQGSNGTNNIYGDIQLDTANQKLVFKDPGTTSSSIGQHPMALDSSGNLEVSGSISSGNITSGAITSTGTLQLDGAFVIDTNGGTQPLCINRLSSTGTADTQALRIHVDDVNAVFISEQDESSRYGGYVFQSRNASTTLTRYAILYSSGDSLWYNGSGSARMRWDASEERLGIGNFSTTNPDRRLHVRTTSDVTMKLDGDTSQWAAIEWRDSGGSAYQWFNGSTETWSLGGTGSSLNSEKRLHVHGGVSIGANLRNTTVAVNGLNVEGNVTSLATLVGANVSAGGVYNYDSSGHLRLLHPAGAAYKTGQSTVTGAIKIVLPVSWTSTMMRMTIKVYEYATGESFTIDCGGYNYVGSSSWINTFAYITGQGGTVRNFAVRFGHDGSKCCIYIGELNSTWSYPQLSVTDFQAGFNSTTSGTWRSGWDITFESSAFGTVTKYHTETDNQIYHHNIAVTGGNLSLRNNTNGDGAIIRDIEFLTTAAPSSDDRSVIIRALNQSGGTSTRGGKLEFLTRKTDGYFNTTTIDSTGALTVQGLSTLESGLQTNNSQLRVKISPWVGTTYGMGMKSGMTFGGLNNYAMTFQMDATADRGWWWGTSSHTDAQGAMALTNAGKLSVASHTRIGMGYTDTAVPSGGMLEVGGGVVVHAGTVWDETTQGAGKGSIHLDPALSTDHAGGAITWGASDTSNGTTGQAGIYVRSDGGYGTRMYLSTTDSYASGSKTALSIDSVGNVSITRGSLVATGNVTAYSDIKLKRDILEIPDALAIVQKIRGVTYERKDKDDGLRHCGVIAQEVEAAGLPEVVRYDEENDVKTVDYGNMVALCIEAIKEQQDQIDAQKEQINQLTNLVNALMEK